MKSLIELLSYTNGLVKFYIGVTIASILVALTGIAVPFVIAEATDLMVEIVGGANIDISQVIFLAVLLFAFDISNALIGNLGGYFGDMMAARLQEQLSTLYYRHLLRLPQSYYDQELTGTIINRLNRAIAELTRFLNMFANSFFEMILTVVITLIIVAIHSWQLAILVLIVYPTFMWLTMLTSKKWQKFQQRKNQVTDIASGRFAEVVSQMRVVKSYVYEKREYNLFKGHYQETVDVTRTQSRFWHKMDVLRSVAVAVIFFAIFAFLFVQTADKNFTIGEMVLLVTLMNRLRQPLFGMSFIVDNYQRAVAGGRDVLEVLRIEPEITDAPDAKNLKDPRGVVKFDEVSFRYDDGKEIVLDGVSFDIKKGEHVALVSESGGGKTTLTSLLMRLYEPTSGVISIDGNDIASLKQVSLRQNIATVFQDPALFSGTIRENIAYGKPGATIEEIEAAAKASNAHDFIKDLDKGYDTEIGERGLKLSGGQKQRIAIARAILKDAPILILDEATSALDSRSEKLVQQALDRLMKGRTTLIIAHRLSTIASVDKIVTLKDGKVDEMGSPKKLAKTDGIYAELLKLQNSSAIDVDERLAKYDIGSGSSS